jgi:hypothetical protein
MTLLSKLSRLCLALSGLCFLAFALQFFVLAYAGARRTAEPPRAGAQADPEADPLKAPLLRGSLLVPSAERLAGSSTGAEPKLPALRALLYVKRDSGRAEVYINGRRATADAAKIELNRLLRGYRCANQNREGQRQSLSTPCTHACDSVGARRADAA